MGDIRLTTIIIRASHLLECDAESLFGVTFEISKEFRKEFTDSIIYCIKQYYKRKPHEEITIGGVVTEFVYHSVAITNNPERNVGVSLLQEKSNRIFEAIIASFAEMAIEVIDREDGLCPETIIVEGWLGNDLAVSLTRSK